MNYIYILSPEAYDKLVYSLAMSDSCVAQEIAELLGGYYDQEDEEYVYDGMYNGEKYHIVELPLDVLINYVEPKDVM